MANVLIVDDSSTMRKIISRSLRQAGLAVDDHHVAAADVAGDGAEADHGRDAERVGQDGGVAGGAVNELEMIDHDRL